MLIKNDFLVFIHSHIQDIQIDGRQCELVGCASPALPLLTAPKKLITGKGCVSSSRLASY